ncbi:esterase/lipase family protein [Clostridium tetani]|uniref:triacylglycerol lipase n=1 Tax=Clostridium tetani TaxID=1513 RepID=A0ABY0ENM8_CLOTA|nr:lipase [Clostridium tetani]CDI49013.1 lipase [Clostridium tetani 12124569]KHO39571.1 lipase [Clostridium tetani]RXI38566.1 lipase [Clostridium tetani]RXI55372.1 lipase [Clostridium tetani]RXI68443.1 lipase [Clostridium tetani]
MKKSLTKIIGITLLTFFISLTNFSVTARAAEQKVRTPKSIKEEINNSMKSDKVEVKEDDINELAPLEFPEINTRSITKGNNYPIILVHGFMGYGRDELLGYKYWGGVVDLQEKLNNSGHKTYTATVAPVSSNWDRACELYAYIVGGTVDYGAAHAKKFGHNRYGRTYPGLYKNISNKNKIHLIGHSMGGQTIRTLTQLLSQGSQEEINYKQENLSPLFQGGNHWIHSVTTISTPNDGTTLSDLMPAGELLSSAFGVLGTITGNNGIFNSLYDFKLDQWGLKKQEGESQRKYIKRVLDSDIWKRTKDIATYDLSTKGAEELNKWVKAQPDVYYFSWTTQATKESALTGHSIAQIGPMNPLLYVPANLMGKYSRNEPNLPIINKEWFPNDGVVNCISQNGPKLGSSDIIEQYDGIAKKGRWNAMPLIINTDHMDITGTFGNVKDWYIDYAKVLNKLPE